MNVISSIPQEKETIEIAKNNILKKSLEVRKLLAYIYMVRFRFIIF